MEPTRGISYGIVQPGARTPDGVPILRVADIKAGRISTANSIKVSKEVEAQHARTRLRGGELLITIVGTVGEMAIVPPSLSGWNIARAIAILPVVEDIGSYWVKLALQAPDVQSIIKSRLNTTVQATLNLRDLAQLKISLPPLQVRSDIIRVIGALEDKIELNRQMNQTLEGLARAIFNDWFIDFGPTRTKIAGASPYLEPRYWDLFPDVLDDFGRPRGWKLSVLGDVLAELETGMRPKGGVNAYTTGIPSIGAESIVGLGIFDYSKTKYVPNEYYNHMRRGHVQNRDIILYKDGGRPGEFEPHLTIFGDGFPFEEMCINEHVYRIRAKSDVGQNWLFFWISSEPILEEMRIKGTGVAIPGLNSTNVRSLALLVPDRDLVNIFNNLTEPLVTKILANCLEIKSLAATRDLLLPKLMSGELELRDAECTVGRQL